MTPGRSEVVARVAGSVAVLRRGGPARIAVTGICAAGKTTFADELAVAVESLGRAVYRCQFDDFHSVGHKRRSARDEYTPRGYYDDAYDFAAFRRCVLDPLDPGGDRRCRFALFSSYRDEFLPEVWTVVEPDAVVIVDGGLLLRLGLAERWDLVIWLDIDAETCVRRARLRDVAWVGDADVVERRYRTRNLPMHQLYIEETGGPARADTVIDNMDPDRPRFVRWPDERARVAPLTD